MREMPAAVVFAPLFKVGATKVAQGHCAPLRHLRHLLIGGVGVVAQTHIVADACSGGLWSAAQPSPAKEDKDILVLKSDFGCD